MKAETMAAPAVTALSSPSSSSLVNGADDELRVTKVLFKLPWKMLSLVLLLMPLASMLICLFTSMVMHGDHINNTICKVYNFLPSISAVTGVSPQRYLWRVCVALHISPRLLVAWVAKSHYVSLAGQVPAARRPSYLTLVFAAFYLNLTELFTLCGVTYISNKENYPVHEKLFTLFMLCSLVYMLCVIRVVHAVRHTLSPSHQASFYHKKLLFATKLAATFGLLFFFWRHRVLCEPKAFSWFSLCEYVLATCNMLYHVSVALDFSEEHVIVGHVVKVSPASSATSLSSPTIAQLHDTVSSPTASLNTYGRGPNIPSVPLTTCDVHLRPSSKSGDSFEGDLVPNTTHKDSMHDPISEASIKDEKNLHLSINVSEATQPATSTISTSSEINVVSSANTVSQDSVDVDAAEVTDVKAANSVGVETCNIKPEHIVHQVLNTIHEDLETSHHNGPTDTIIQRRPQTQSIESIAQTNENDAQRLAPNIHAHSE
ncbi:unnamed protein product [Meganyctiphanes norvegica]|uniref:CWH43-like N-terminal domain-containing protein n=1 Tax=Meganyctiphanes norvegica TaxID=48144 RepID=A0AAV2PIG4_MEGNR